MGSSDHTFPSADTSLPPAGRGSGKALTSLQLQPQSVLFLRGHIGHVEHRRTGFVPDNFLKGIKDLRRASCDLCQRAAVHKPLAVMKARMERVSIGLSDMAVMWFETGDCVAATCWQARSSTGVRSFGLCHSDFSDSGKQAAES